MLDNQILKLLFLGLGQVSIGSRRVREMRPGATLDWAAMREEKGIL